MIAIAYAGRMINFMRLSACGRDQGRTCEFYGLPTRGRCKGLGAFAVVDGYLGDTRPDGLRVGGVYRRPGADA